MSRPRLTSDELIAAAKQHYVGQGWVVPSKLTARETVLWDSLSRRPEFVAKRQGMEYLVFATGKVTEATYKLFKQVLYDIDNQKEPFHLVLACEERIPVTDEKALKQMGLGVLLIRSQGDPLLLVRPRLRSFREPSTYYRVPQHLRAKVKHAIRDISEGDVCVGVLDLAQIMEGAIKGPGITAKTLGSKISQARARNILSAAGAAAAHRVNVPRIKRAHPASHSTRRTAIVARCQQIVEDCLAVLFALATRTPNAEPAMDISSAGWAARSAHFQWSSTAAV